MKRIRWNLDQPFRSVEGQPAIVRLSRGSGYHKAHRIDDPIRDANFALMNPLIIMRSGDYDERT